MTVGCGVPPPSAPARCVSHPQHSPPRPAHPPLRPPRPAPRCSLNRASRRSGARVSPQPHRPHTQLYLSPAAPAPPGADEALAHGGVQPAAALLVHLGRRGRRQLLAQRLLRPAPLQQLDPGDRLERLPGLLPRRPLRPAVGLPRRLHPGLLHGPQPHAPLPAAGQPGLQPHAVGRAGHRAGGRTHPRRHHAAVGGQDLVDVRQEAQAPDGLQQPGPPGKRRCLLDLRCPSR